MSIKLKGSVGLPQPLVLAPQALVCLGFWRDSEGAVYRSGWKDMAESSARNPGNKAARLDQAAVQSEVPHCILMKWNDRFCP